MSGLFLVLASFLASTVEMVEALTIVLAAGVTRGWRSSFVGVAAALVVLAVIIALLGPALILDSHPRVATRGRRIALDLWIAMAAQSDFTREWL